jgi:hypothetical protein
VLGKVTDMQTKRAIETPDAAAPLGAGSWTRTPLAKLAAVLRGDRYMVDAYPAATASVERDSISSPRATRGAARSEER